MRLGTLPAVVHVLLQLARCGIAAQGDSRFAGVLAASGNAEALPGTPVDAFEVKTIAGTYSYPGSAKATRPVVLLMFNPVDPFHRTMFTTWWSAQGFLLDAPATVDYLFAINTASQQDATNWSFALYTLLSSFAQDASTKYPDQKSSIQSLWSQCYFATTPGKSINGQLSSFLDSWHSDFNLLVAGAGSDQFEVARLDPISNAGWQAIERVDQLSNLATTTANPCRRLPRTQAIRVSGKWVLARNSSRASVAGCGYQQILSNLQAAGASGVVVVADAGAAVEPIDLDDDHPQPASFFAAGSRARSGGSGTRNAAWPQATGEGERRRTFEVGELSEQQLVQLQQQQGMYAAGSSSSITSERQWRVERYWAMRRRAQQEAAAVAKMWRGKGSGGLLEGNIDIPFTMVSNQDGERLQAALTKGGGSLAIKPQTVAGPGDLVTLDPEYGFTEPGMKLFPTLMSLGWVGHWHSALAQARQEAAKPAQAVTLFKNAKLHASAEALVALPPRDAYTRMQLDLSLGCDGTWDADCPEWDYSMHMWVCCGQPCNAACAYESRRGSSSAAAAGAFGFGDPSPYPNPACGVELARWITPYRRRGGRWVTDVSHMLPVLNASSCTFKITLPPWLADPWYVNVTLRFATDAPSAATGAAAAAPAATVGAATGASATFLGQEALAQWGLHAPTPSPAAPLKPKTVVPLFYGSQFNSAYNARAPIKFKTPPGTRAAKLSAAITGHGMAQWHNCAEFCPTSHHFTLNGKEFSIEFPMEDDSYGCTATTRTGTIAHQYGTWWYGRNGWCPGSKVAPWVVDVTSVLAPPGGDNVVTYRGLLDGQDPEPEQTDANIMMASQVTFYQ